MTTYYVVVGHNIWNDHWYVPDTAITLDEEQAKRWAIAWGKAYKRKYIMVSVDESEL